MPVIRVALGAVLVSVLLAFTPNAYAGVTEQAKRLHDRIAGVPPSDSTLQDMVDALNTTTATDAALIATNSPGFYNATLPNFAKPWTNREGSVFVELNDYVALVVGLVRDNVDFREVLSADRLYIASGAPVPAYSPTNNDHFRELERSGEDLEQVLQATTQSAQLGIPASAAAGAMTTRAAARAFFIDGTNRAMFRFTMLNHLCTDMEQMLDTSRVPDRIRQDVARSPGGDSRVFLNNCIGCHAGMDALSGAFAYYDYRYDADTDPEGVSGRLHFNTAADVDPVTNSRVDAKYYNNANNFPQGFITTDDSWINYWRAGQNAHIGWAPGLAGSGVGAKALGIELARTERFAQCQVEKVFENVCLRPPQDASDLTAVQSLVTTFKSSGFNLRHVFAGAGAHCMGD